MRKTRLAFALVIALILTACGSSTSTTVPSIQPTRTPTTAPPTTTPTPTQTPLPPTAIVTRTPYLAVDCGFYAQVGAWIDQDGDGVRGYYEAALADVRFFLDYAASGRGRAYSAVTNRAGQERIFIFLPGCGGAKFEAYAEVPPGYRAVTPLRGVVDQDNLKHEVGFVKEP